MVQDATKRWSTLRLMRTAPFPYFTTSIFRSDIQCRSVHGLIPRNCAAAGTARSSSSVACVAMNLISAQIDGKDGTHRDVVGYRTVRRRRSGSSDLLRRRQGRAKRDSRVEVRGVRCRVYLSNRRFDWLSHVELLDDLQRLAQLVPCLRQAEMPLPHLLDQARYLLGVRHEQAVNREDPDREGSIVPKPFGRGAELSPVSILAGVCGRLNQSKKRRRDLSGVPRT
jgi:hypothetical protein